MQRQGFHDIPYPNQDESLVTGEHPFVGNFHKTLLHNRYGEVNVPAYRLFERTCIEIEAGVPINFEGVPSGPLVPSPEVPQTAFDPGMSPTPAIEALARSVARFTSPMAGAATEEFGPDPKTLFRTGLPGEDAGPLLQPGYRQAGTPGLEAFCGPQSYPLGPSSDAERITVEGELNKLASNVAMGRSMGGVHWRSDNTRSLRLGEQVAIEILRKRSAEYAERPLSFRFRSFDGEPVLITRGEVLRN